MFVADVILFITLAMRGSVVLSTTSWTRQYRGPRRFGPPRGLVTWFSVFNVVGTTATIIGIFFSKGLAIRYGKRAVFIAGLWRDLRLHAVFAVAAERDRANVRRPRSSGSSCTG